MPTKAQFNQVLDRHCTPRPEEVKATNLFPIRLEILLTPVEREAYFSCQQTVPE